MSDKFFAILYKANSFYWDYIGFSVIILVGMYFTIKTRGYQFRAIFKTITHMKDLHQDTKEEGPGIHPLRLYFASIGGMVSISNMVGVVAAVTIGGPGGLFWLWVASFCGMLIKYSEIYLGITHRVKTNKNTFDGGPMYYLQYAFKNRIVPIISSVLLCIYGAEVYQFLIITDTVTKVIPVKKELVVLVMLFLVMYSAIGGVGRLTSFCTLIMPPFLTIYILICCYVLGQNWQQLIDMIPIIFNSAFNGHSAVGGFVGSSLILAAQYGTSRAVYSSDIGIGYDSIILSETKTKYPEKQARIAIFSLFSDTLICTFSCLVILVTGVWQDSTLKNSEYVAKALGMYVPYIDIFILILFFSAGTITVIAYLVVGLKCARFINSKWGEIVYSVYALFALAFFSFCDQSNVILIMSLSGGLLMLTNLCGVIKMRDEIVFK